MTLPPSFFFFFFNDTATTEIYTLSLHDALPILHGATHIRQAAAGPAQAFVGLNGCEDDALTGQEIGRATSELQSQSNLVCRLLLEKKKKKETQTNTGNKTYPQLY